MKFKHNKRRNTAFLYEILVLELAKAIKEHDKPAHQKILETLKTFFSKNTLIGKELKIFNAILESKNVDMLDGEKILNEAKREHNLINQTSLLAEQDKAYASIKKVLSQQAFSNFIPNYRDLASISQIFNKELSIKTRVLLEKEILKNMTSSLLKEEKKMVPIDNLVLKSFVTNFNEKYKSLFEEQKTLLNKFVLSFSDNGLGLKVFLNEEIGRLKKEMSDSLKLKEISEDQNMTEKGKEVLKLLESFASTPIDNAVISKVIKIQNLIREIKS